MVPAVDRSRRWLGFVVTLLTILVVLGAGQPARASEAHEIPFVKRPDQGKMKDVTFIKYPNGYWIEIVEAARLSDLGR